MIDKLKSGIIDEDIKRIIAEDLPWSNLAGMTVLVTGASGMIPSYVVYTMLGLNDTMDLGIHILALVRNKAKAEKIFGDLLQRDDITLIAQDVTLPLNIDGPVDYIFHGASAARPSEHKAAPTSTIRANLVGTFNLLDLAVEKKSRSFILMSSSEVYGKVEDSLSGITESDYGYLDCLNPRSCYSEGKRAAETICASFHAQYGIDCKTPRFAHVYGPGMGLTDGRVQADFAANVYRGEDIVMKSDGSSQRAYTYVGDAVAGIFYILFKGEDMAYNVADSENVISIRQLAEAFIACRPEKKLKLVIEIDNKNAGMFNPAKFIGLDNSKLISLGWKPSVNITEGTRRMVSYLEQTHPSF